MCIGWPIFDLAATDELCGATYDLVAKLLVLYFILLHSILQQLSVIFRTANIEQAKCQFCMTLPIDIVILGVHTNFTCSDVQFNSCGYYSGKARTSWFTLYCQRYLKNHMQAGGHFSYLIA